jgi:hypothetical protein
LPHAPELSAGWRIQADRASQSFRIEHREADRWLPAAAFAIHAGACKPAPLESNPPDQPAPVPPSPAPPPHR